MGYTDIVTKEYMRENAVFADAFNYFIYNGEQVIMPENLHELDTTELSLPLGSENTSNNSSHDSVQKYRDILKSAVIKRDNKVAYIILGIENQSDVHYAMPVRNIIYDALQYGKQVSDISAAHRKNEADINKKHSRSEYLSGFYKDDYIKPVITLVMHFGAEKWDGPLSLYDMMDIDDPKLMELIQNYRIHIVEPAGMAGSDLLKFSTSLREVMGCIKYSDNNKKLRAFIDDNPRMTMNINAARVISAVTNIKLDNYSDTEVIDVCKAIEDMIEEGKAEVREEMAQAFKDMIEKGSAEGTSEGIAEVRREMIQAFKDMIDEGRVEGKFNILADLVRDGLITLSEAAKRADMSEYDFQSALNKGFN